MEMRAELDTNRLTDLFRVDTELAEILSLCDEVWIPLIVLGEIRAGFMGATRLGGTKLCCTRYGQRRQSGSLSPVAKLPNSTREFLSSSGRRN